MRRVLLVFTALLVGGSTAIAGSGQQAPAPVEGVSPSGIPTAVAVKFITPTIFLRHPKFKKRKWIFVTQTGPPAIFEGTKVMAFASQWGADVGGAPGGKISVLIIGYRTARGWLNQSKTFLFKKMGEYYTSIDVDQWKVRKDGSGGLDGAGGRGLWVTSGENDVTGYGPVMITKQQRLAENAVVVKQGEILKVRDMPFFTCKPSAIDVLCSTDVSNGAAAYIRLYAPWTQGSYTLRIRWSTGEERLIEQGAVPPPDADETP